MGVDILEKHITHDRALKGLDHEAALNPDEFDRFVKMVRTIDASMGISVPKPFSEEELKYRKYSKKSVVAGRDLPAQTRLTAEDLQFMRTDELGLPPDQGFRLLGRLTKHAIERYRSISEEDVA